MSKLDKMIDELTIIRHGRAEPIFRWGTSDEEVVPKVKKAIKSLLNEQLDELDKWVRKMLFDHDGSQTEYRMWLSKWEAKLKEASDETE